MTRKQSIYEFLRKMKSQHGLEAAYTTEEIAGAVGASRANVSSDLNRLFEEELVEKLLGWPVKYRASATVLTPMPDKRGLQLEDADSVFEHFIGYNGSMSLEIEKAKASILYPGSGLPMLIGGKTGVGKTTFAKLMYEYAKRVNRINKDAAFVCFNCADYANNPQLIMSQLFGLAKGAYTGAEEERIGLVEQADGGVLFLDEVHRLPETAQEMLFLLMDFGQYRRLGESDVTRFSHPIIIMATTESKDSALLATFNRRVPITINLPSLAERSLLERFRLIQQIFSAEARKLSRNIRVDSLAVKALMAYECPGNVGQLENDVRVSCARAYVACLMGKADYLNVSIQDVPLYVKEGILKLKDIYSDINLIANDIEIRLDEAADPGFAEESPPSMDIYDILERRHHDYSRNTTDSDYLEIAMIMDVESYFRDLLLSAQSPTPNENPFDYLSDQALDITHQVEEILKCNLGLSLDEHARVALALHINATLERLEANKPIVYPVLSRIRESAPAVFDTAEEIVQMMRQDFRVDLPDDEVGFIANLLLQLMNDSNQSQVSGMLAICHGLGSAKKMAKVANHILGRDFVHWLDLTGELPPEQLRAVILAKLSEMHTSSSYMILADSDALLQTLNQLRDSFQKPIYAVSNISTSMVIETALMLSEHNASAEAAYRYLKTFEQGFNELFELEAKKMTQVPEKRVILTACISGCGAAVRLKHIIEERFDLPEEIEVIAMDISSIAALKNRIVEISSAREVICVVGVDVGLEISFPFISMDEFVVGNGIQRLSNILTSYHINQRGAMPQSVPSTSEEYESRFFSGSYLNGYLFYLDGEKLAPYLRECLSNIEASRGTLRTGKRIMLCIHLCALVERILFEGLPEEQPGVQAPAKDLTAALEPLCSAYHIRIPASEYEMIEQILAVVLNK